MYAKIMVASTIAASLVLYSFAVNQQTNAGPGDRDSQMGVACQNALEGKCFHGAPVDLSVINSPGDTEGFCVSHPNFCSVDECTARINVIKGFASGGTNGNPCE